MKEGGPHFVIMHGSLEEVQVWRSQPVDAALARAGSKAQGMRVRGWEFPTSQEGAIRSPR